MWLEILLALFSKLSDAMAFIAFLTGIGFAIALVFNCFTSGYKDEDKDAEVGFKITSKAIKIVGPICAITFILSCAPSIDDLWKVRIGLIKLHLASPENINKGVDVIERIGKKLECKYLGCEDPADEK